MSFEKVAMEQIEEIISTPFTACLLSDGIKVVLEERIREFKENNNG